MAYCPARGHQSESQNHHSVSLTALVVCWIALFPGFHSDFPGSSLCAQDPVDDELEQSLRREQHRAEIINRAVQPTISVFDSKGQGGGSGVLISTDGFALTNYHVVKPCGTYMHCSLPDGNLYDAVLVGLDPTGDVALIKLLGRTDFPKADIGDSDEVLVGQHCFAVGNPFLLATDFQPTVTWGIVSGVHRYQYPAGTLLEYADCIQTDAAINPGNSGGPLFNAQGKLIGINGRGSFEKRGRVNVGVGYSISINQIQYFMSHLMSGRIVDHASMGATVATDSRGAVRIDNILQTSDAWRRGLRYDDEIVSFAGRPIDTVNQFKNVLGIYPMGWRIPLVYRRDGQENEILVRLAGVHSPEELFEQVQGPALPANHPGLKKPASDSSDIPDSAKKMIEENRGYANRYFNRQMLESIWSSSVSSGDPTSLPKRWTVSGKSGTFPFKLVLGPGGAGLQWDDKTFVLDPNQDLGQQLHPAETGGFLPAIYMWQRLLSLGTNAYGDVYYFGELPHGEELVRRDVLIGNYDIGESRFFFERTSGQLRGLEFWTESTRDPCEIQFDDFRSSGGVELPHQLTVRFGDDGPWVIEVDQYEFDDNE